MFFRPIVLALLIGSLGWPVAHASEGCPIGAGGRETPDIADPASDGFLSTTIDPSFSPSDPTDVTAVWFDRDSRGKTIIHVIANNVLQAQSNVVYYVLWDYQGSDPANEKTRFVKIQPRPYGAVFRYGYYEPADPGVEGTSGGAYTTLGDTTGTVGPGSPGEMTIVAPLDKLGKPGPGDLLGRPSFKTAILAGSPGLPNSVPVNPSGGYALKADNSANGAACDAIVL